MLVFVVALQSPDTAHSWDRVCQYWERTLRSLCAQTNPDFRVFLVCNEAPKINFTHPAVTVLEHPFPSPGTDKPRQMRDKWIKVKYGLIHARSLAPAFFTIADADDNVHRGLAAYAAAHPQAHGWNFRRGYIWEGEKHSVSYLPDFDDYCGTSAMIRLQPEDIPQSMEEPNTPYAVLTHGHGIIREEMARRGRPLKELPFKGAIYNCATGENHSEIAPSAWRGVRATLRRWSRWRPLTEGMRRTYGLYDVG